MAIRFNGVDCPSYVVISEVNTSLTPTIETKKVSVPGRAGSYDFGNDLGERTIEVVYTLIADSQADLRVKARSFVDWIYTEEAKELVLLEEPNKYYLAKLSGDTNLSEVLNIGQGTLTFVCTDPHLYADEKYQTVVMNGKKVTNLVNDRLYQDTDLDGVADGWGKVVESGNTATFSIEDSAQKIDLTASTTAGKTAYIQKNDVPVVAGRVYDLIADHRSANWVGTFRYNIVIDWRDASNVNLGYSNSAYITKPVGEWSRLTLSAVTAPANAVKANLKLQVQAQAAGDKGTVWLDNVQFVEEGATVEDATFTVTNNGGRTTYPVFECEFTADTTDFLLKDTKGKFVYLGQPLPSTLNSSGIAYTAKAKRTRLLYEDGTFSGWSVSTLGVDGASSSITGTMTSTGDRIKVATWGTPTAGWYGPAYVKSFKPAGQGIQDFTFQTFIKFDSTQAKQTGRIEFYFISNNVKVGKVAFVDPTASKDDPIFEARAGDLATGDYVINMTPEVGAWTDFYGMLKVQRIGSRWYAYIGRYDSKTGKFWGQASAAKIYNNKYLDKIDAIQMHMGVSGATTPVATMEIDSIEMWEENVIDPSKEVPVLFQAGDRLTIDSERGLVLRNGLPIFDEMNPSSQFIELVKGTNSLTISPATVTNARVRYKERWL